MLEATTGKDRRAIPYQSHVAVPATNVTYIPVDIPWVSRVRSVLIAWGTNETLVSSAAM